MEMDKLLNKHHIWEDKIKQLEKEKDEGLKKVWRWEKINRLEEEINGLSKDLCGTKEENKWKILLFFLQQSKSGQMKLKDCNVN